MVSEKVTIVNPSGLHLLNAVNLSNSVSPVSYTHLDVYKRQELRLNQKIRNDRTNFPVIFNENCNRTGSCR